MFGTEFLVASGLYLNVNASASGMQCRMDKAPTISVTPASDPVRYDFSQTTQQLTAMKTDTVSPYAPGTVTLTDGIRRDKPTIKTQITQSIQIDPVRNVFCMNYDTITINIHLQPVIFLASEMPPGKCRDAVLEHEQKHVRVDREIINEFSVKIGQSVQGAVNEIGVMGPLNMDQKDQTQVYMNDHIANAIKFIELPLFNEMHRRQAEVDSLEEYNRVNAICGR